MIGVVFVCLLVCAEDLCDKDQWLKHPQTQFPGNAGAETFACLTLKNRRLAEPFVELSGFSIRVYITKAALPWCYSKWVHKQYELAGIGYYCDQPSAFNRSTKPLWECGTDPCSYFVFRLSLTLFWAASEAAELGQVLLCSSVTWTSVAQLSRNSPNRNLFSDWMVLFLAPCMVGKRVRFPVLRLSFHMLAP